MTDLHFCLTKVQLCSRTCPMTHTKGALRNQSRAGYQRYMHGGYELYVPNFTSNHRLSLEMGLSAPKLKGSTLALAA